MDRFSLKGKTAIVTGSSRGIGRAIAIAYARAGARVVVTSRKLDACNAVVEQLRGEGLEAMAIACNISGKEQVAALVDQTEKAYGPVDVLVCNAAVNPYYGPMSGITDEAFSKVMDVNIRSNLWLVNRVAPGMAERGGGSIVIISSIAGLTGSRVLGAYAISKAADMQLARNLALEWGKQGVRTNCIAPGLIKTDFAKALWDNPQTLAAALASSPLNAIGEPEDIAGAALLLGSDAGRFITGTTIVIDGGATIGGEA
ncbi:MULTISPECIES: SDR family oxidoreductase [unclassified Variovorax]|uniref:SDR family NAD(P)-dependent oxidoreductase n=1 Tax=unclassified Variovorax TaxID=663243 RepID=UPI00076C13B2|nr:MULTISPECIES: SDR family oxidoreductase [unclassified Variovorax]KWT83944.1 3-oxoacyl-[acyl-carrier protein] reductase [Variovorax sp. WDL1]PNG46623.1 7-alpha-hydroxysteroid dehydrogenase [Variovorax sp. B2]PNG47555.1 7-alpha-hydroxysteroid dehydrogenase [Variovorax sp. B4]VTV14401.1 7-alpha-hydroxysteroid dehydrogenase [Variovorax sp. WDL1]